ncbi:hypothetical protein [Xenorhabdus cabanillasii]|uniref:hypothetical protein n=1 Tax=Xenorhabdus cabanillasii TaxID=351673 RepID=UPI001FD51FB7|nr:hypothetical protein [Xenorhabdus cabanillasii]
MILKDIPKNAANKIKKLPGVITVVINSGQFQIVIGTHVADIYTAISQLINKDLLKAAPKEKNGLCIK